MPPRKLPKFKRAVFLAPLKPVILNDKKLSTLDRFLISLIIQLSHGETYCFASNKYLGRILNCQPSTISKSINKMHKMNYIVANEPDPKRGGRVNRRKVRDDLKYYIIRPAKENVEDDTDFSDK